MKILIIMLIVLLILSVIAICSIFNKIIKPLKSEQYRCKEEIDELNNINNQLRAVNVAAEETRYQMVNRNIELMKDLDTAKDLIIKQADEISLLKQNEIIDEGLEDKRAALLDSLASVQNAIQERNILLHEMELKLQEETARLDEAHRKEKDSLKAMQTMETRSKEIEDEVNKLMAQQEDLKTRIEDLKV